MTLNVRAARRRLLVFLAQRPKGEVLGEARARDLQLRLGVDNPEMQQLVSHLMEARVVEYVGPGTFDVKLTDTGRTEAKAR